MKNIAFVVLTLSVAGCSSNLDYNEAHQRNDRRITTEELRDDARFMVEAKSASLLLLEMSRLATEKGYSATVQAFANQLARDHERLNDQLHDVAGNEKIKLPREMSESHRLVLQNVADAERQEFDRYFIRSVERVYEDKIRLYKNIATTGQNDEIRAFAAKTLGMLRANEERADELEGQLN